MANLPTTSASKLDASDEEIQRTAEMYRPKPLGSLVASAQRITNKKIANRRGWGKAEDWQGDAWDMHDLVGEQHFLANTLAGRQAQAKFYVGRVSQDPTEIPEPLDDDQSLASKVFTQFRGSAGQWAQIVRRCCQNLFVAGDGWLCGIPKYMLPDNDIPRPEQRVSLSELSLTDLEWKMLSVSEISANGTTLKIILGEGPDEIIETTADDVYLIRVWEPHPRRWWQADSATRASLPVLRELVSLTMHISAQVDSRLAGAGILVVPDSARRAIAIAQGLDPDTESDPFTEALMEAMSTAIRDRSSAAAVVPLVVTVPDEATGLFQHITFSTPLDGEARNLRDEAIRRLALGQDCPPELLLGTADTNHWGAWLVRDDVVTTHVEPRLALICDAVTTQFLWPVLIATGMPEEEAKGYVIWYDVSQLVQRPNRFQDAQVLHANKAISDDAFREAGGFGDSDAPTPIQQAVEIAVEMAVANPALVDNMAEIIAAFSEVLNPAYTNEVTLPESPTETGEEVLEGDPAVQPAAQVTTTTNVNNQPGTGAQNQGPPDTAPAGLAAAGSWNDTHDDEGHTSACIVALPDDPDELPGPEEKHATLVYFGETAVLEEFAEDAREMLMASVAAVAAKHAPEVCEVVGDGLLGNDDPKAHVLFLDPRYLLPIRHALLAETNVDVLHNVDPGVTHYPRFTAHVTMGYGELDEQALRDAANHLAVRFDRLALWWGDERYEFDLAGYHAHPDDPYGQVNEHDLLAQADGEAPGEWASTNPYADNPLYAPYPNSKGHTK
jgi:hypothetical protein